MDIRNFIIGFLLATTMFLFMGNVQNNSNEISAKSIKIINDKGKTVAKISSSSSGGELILYDNAGNIRIYSSSIEGGGVLSIANDKGNYVASIGTDVNKDGTFTLMDRYGDIGYNITGKR